MLPLLAHAHCKRYVPHTTYERTNVSTPPAICLGTPVPRQKEDWERTDTWQTPRLTLNGEKMMLTRTEDLGFVYQFLISCQVFPEIPALLRWLRSSYWVLDCVKAVPDHRNMSKPSLVNLEMIS